MQAERDNEERLIVRVQTTVYRRDYPELWEHLQHVPPKRRGAALMAAAYRALAFQQAARTLANSTEPLQKNTAMHMTPPTAPVHPAGAVASIPARLTSQEQQRPPSREIAAVSPEAEAIASAFTAEELAAFISWPMRVS